MPLLEKYASTIVNTVRDSLLLLDAGAAVRFANAAYYRTFDAAPDQTVGRSIFELGSGQWDAPEVRLLLDRVAGHPAAFESVDVTRSFDRIGARCMRISAQELDRSEGRTVLLVIQDVTLERTAELELNRRLSELAVSNEALSHFAGITAHDLREPLRKVRSYGELLTETAGSKLDDAERAQLARMLAASERLQQLIDASLTLARLAAGALRRQPTSLQGLVGDVIADLDVLVRESGATFDIGRLPRLEIDAALMRAVFQNLFVNAMKFRRPATPPRIRVDACEEPGAARITVQDNGIGFPPEDAARIFQPFLRLHPRATYDGVGIGLAVCRRVLERHEGTITAQGSPGAGATFVLTIPLREGT